MGNECKTNTAVPPSEPVDHPTHGVLRGSTYWHAEHEAFLTEYRNLIEKHGVALEEFRTF